jgi:hypothetical protein
LIAARKRDLAEVGYSRIRPVIGQQEFASPGLAVLAVAVAVQRDTQDFFSARNPVFKKGSQDMSIVVLDLKIGKA